jgi:tetratricopeptide (TPR) repeat protein
MVSTNVSPPAAPPPASRRSRRRAWLILAVCVLLLAGGFAACEGWAFWQERSARRAADEEQFDEAQRYIDLALLVRERWTSTHLLAARIARLRGAYSEAEGHLSRCEQLVGMTEPLQREWLLLRCEEGQVDELAPGLLAAVDGGDPQSPAILEALAGVYMRQARYWEALRCLDRWVARAPDSVRALDWRGWVNNQLDHRGQAISDYERVLELQPGRSVVRLRLAQNLIESSRYEEAVSHLERLRAEQPANPEVLTALARCRMVQSRTDDARDLLDSVLAGRPDDFDALFQRGKVETETGNFAEAEPWLRKALQRSPRDPEARYLLYLCLQEQGNRQEEAEAELTRWQQDRRSRDRLSHLLRTELGGKPNDPDLAEEAGELFLQQGEDRRGLFWLNRALSLDPRHAASRRALLAYYERTDDTARAEEQRQQLAALGVSK